MEERLKVLKMVEDGKVTVDEATKLLETLKSTTHEPITDFNEKISEFAQDMKDFCKDIGTKMNELYKDAEPKIKEFTKTVVEKTANIADNISTTLNEKIKDMEVQSSCCDCSCEEENDSCCCDEQAEPLHHKKQCN
jgi:polyhydroxyalkanoate synthesis regulator phasin